MPTNRVRTRLRALLMAAATALTLAACGGGGGGDSGDGLTQEQRDDRTASASVSGLIAFLTTLVASATSDSSEARNVSGITPPVTDSAEPTSL